MDFLKNLTAPPIQNPIGEKNTTPIAMKRVGILEDDERVYEAPGSFPEDARMYLHMFARCDGKVMSARLVGVAMSRVYGWEANLDGFKDELDLAARSFHEVLQTKLVSVGMFGRGVAQVQALQTYLRGAWPERYQEKQHVEADVKLSWTQLVKEVGDMD